MTRRPESVGSRDFRVHWLWLVRLAYARAGVSLLLLLELVTVGCTQDLTSCTVGEWNAAFNHIAASLLE